MSAIAKQKHLREAYPQVVVVAKNTKVKKLYVR